MRRVAQLFTITALTALSIAAFAKVVPERGCPWVTRHAAEMRAEPTSGECPVLRDSGCPFKNGEPVEQNGEPQPQRDVRLVASVL